MVYQSSNSDSEQGSFNQAVAFVNRLNEIQKYCYFFRRTENLDDWKDALDSIYAEIHTFLRKDKKNGSLEAHEKIKASTDFLKGEFKKMKYGLRSQTFTNGKKFDKIASYLHHLLDRWEIMLKDSIDDYGLLMPKMDDPRFAVAH